MMEFNERQVLPPLDLKFKLFRQGNYPCSVSSVPHSSDRLRRPFVAQRKAFSYPALGE